MKHDITCQKHLVASTCILRLMNLFYFLSVVHLETQKLKSLNQYVYFVQNFLKAHIYQLLKLATIKTKFNVVVFAISVPLVASGIFLVAHAEMVVP